MVVGEAKNDRWRKMETKSENLDEPVVFHRTTLKKRKKKKKKEEEKQEGEEKEAKS